MLWSSSTFTIKLLSELVCWSRCLHRNSRLRCSGPVRSPTSAYQSTTDVHVVSENRTVGSTRTDTDVVSVMDCLTWRRILIFCLSVPVGFGERCTSGGRWRGWRGARCQGSEHTRSSGRHIRFIIFGSNIGPVSFNGTGQTICK